MKIDENLKDDCIKLSGDIIDIMNVYSEKIKDDEQRYMFLSISLMSVFASFAVQCKCPKDAIDTIIYNLNKFTMNIIEKK